jgi:hypothetical protein
MAHQVVVTEESYIFKAATKTKLFILLGVGVLLFVVGLVLAMNDGGGDHHGDAHGSLQKQELLASAQQDQHGSVKEGHEQAAHHESDPWLKRLKTTLWMNNIYFIGFGLIGLFFVAIQYAAMAGWSVGVKRVAMAFGNWIPVAGLITLVLFFFVQHDVFHWSHSSLFA